ncbi:hypothetical protein O1611_g695 [Lasiodiplodia mahajangana]|uniref:Uncharacterized protein n=1 Tax=Lasiodiplodia mahajangana TaxID=1108764 RepID=A0ACC2JZH4_9PEZI|nr:hypothetical protein O1611_g695 [Lasiodiplodia mahajangana]
MDETNPRESRCEQAAMTSDARTPLVAGYDIAHIRKAKQRNATQRKTHATTPHADIGSLAESKAPIAWSQLSAARNGRLSETMVTSRIALTAFHM